MARTKEAKKAKTDNWPVAFSPLRQKVVRKKKDTLDFVDYSSAEEEAAPLLKRLPALETGTVLEACNGSDIQLARGASARPNIAKGRGRYLIILPGMMSFKTRGKKAPEGTNEETNDSNADSKAAKAKHDDDYNDSEEDEKKNSEAIKEDLDKKPPAKRNPFAPRVTALGKIENIKSDSPIMKVPFGDGRSLVFQGKKVETSSKYMMMNCKASKGSVTCKDIFSSAIIFGEAKWEGEAATQNSDDEHEQAEEAAPFRHYGGSNRTCDGAVSGAAMKQLQKKRAAKPRAINGSTGDSDVEMLDDDDDDESDEDIAIKVAPPPRAPRPKRRASSQKKIEIPDSEDESEEEEMSKETGVDPKEKVPSTARAPTQKQRASSKATIEIADSDDSEEFNVDMKGAPPPRAPRQRRRASSRTTIEIPDSDESGEEDEEREAEAPPPRAQTGKRKSAQKQVETSSEEGSEADIEETTQPQAPKSKRKAVPQSKKAPVFKRKAASQKKAPVAAKRARTSKASKEESDDELNFDSSSSSEVIVVDKDDDEDYLSPDGNKEVVVRRTPRSSRARRLAKQGKLGLKETARQIDLTEGNSEDLEEQDTSDEEEAAEESYSDESDHEE